MARKLSHLDARGRVRMGNVSAKRVTTRVAVARGRCGGGCWGDPRGGRGGGGEGAGGPGGPGGIPYRAAGGRVRGGGGAFPAETIPLLAARGRALRRAYAASHALPPFRNSSMD